MKKNYILFMSLTTALLISAHYETGPRPFHYPQSPQLHFGQPQSGLKIFHRDAQHALNDAIHNTQDAFSSATQDAVHNAVARPILNTVETSVGTFAGKIYNTLTGNSKANPVTTSSTISPQGFELPAPKKNSSILPRTKNAQ